MTNPIPDAARQQQFLNVISRDEATQRFQSRLKLEPLGTERLPLAATVGPRAGRGCGFACGCARVRSVQRGWFRGAGERHLWSNGGRPPPGAAQC